MDTMYGSKFLVSIIIPVYNTEIHLRKCLDSAVNQTFQDIEIIVVDDGSLGSCKEICGLYPRVKYISYGENRGLFCAREYGVRSAQGEYILNLDSDDWLPSDICAHVAEAGVFDLLLSQTISVYRFHRERASWSNKGLKEVQQDNILPLLFERSFSSWATWGKVFRRDLALTVYKELAVRGHLTMAEDFLFFTAYSYYVRQTKVLQTVGYYYNLTSESVNRTVPALQKLEKHWADLSLVIDTFHRFFANKTAPSPKPLEEELLFTFLTRFTDPALLSKFLPSIVVLFGAEALSPSVVLGIEVQKNIFLRLLSKGFGQNTFLYRFLRFMAGALTSSFQKY